MIGPTPLQRAYMAAKVRGEVVDYDLWQRMLETQHRVIAETLATFARGSITLSALQPVLDLAVELNPELRNR